MMLPQLGISGGCPPRGTERRLDEHRGRAHVGALDDRGRAYSGARAEDRPAEATPRAPPRPRRTAARGGSGRRSGRAAPRGVSADDRAITTFRTLAPVSATKVIARRRSGSAMMPSITRMTTRRGAARNPRGAEAEPDHRGDRGDDQPTAGDPAPVENPAVGVTAVHVGAEPVGAPRRPEPLPRLHLDRVKRSTGARSAIRAIRRRSTAPAAMVGCRRTSRPRPERTGAALSTGSAGRAGDSTGPPGG
jgi:hypothetical protein